MTNLVKLAMEGQFEQIPTLSMEEYRELENKIEKFGKDIGVDLDEAERASSVASALEDLAFVAEQIERPTVREAALIQIAADAAMSGTGVDGSAVVPAMEDASDGPGIAARIKDIVAKIIQALKDMLAALYKKVKEYLDGTERYAQQLKKRVAEIRQNIKNAPASNGKAIEVIAMNKYVRSSSVIPLRNGKEMIAAISEYNKFITAYTKGTSSYLSNLSGNVDGFYTACLTDDREKMRKSMKNLTGENSIFWLTPYGRKAPFFGEYQFRSLIEADSFLEGLQVSARMPARKTADVEDSPLHIAEAFNEIVSVAGVVAIRYPSRSSEKIMMTPLQASTLNTLLDNLEETINDITLIGGRGTLASEFKYHVDMFDDLVSKLSKTAKSLETKKENLADYLPYLNTIKSVSTQLSRAPFQAYSRVIANNIDIVKRGIAIATVSVDAGV